LIYKTEIHPFRQLPSIDLAAMLLTEYELFMCGIKWSEDAACLSKNTKDYA
jgi:hypothetical protein